MSFRKLLLLLVFAASTLALTAQVKVNGVVVDEDGEPVIGASVVQKGKPSNGVATDIDGKFTLTVPNKSHLVVTYVGYEKQEVEAKSGVMKITLKVSGQVLEGVVVTGMAKVDARMFTGATTKIDDTILELWNQIEAHYADLPPETRFNACRKLGVIYYYRRHEPHIY